MMVIRKNILICFMLISTLSLITENINAKGAGGQAAAFLRLGVGARAIAMGNAYTAITNEVSAIYWNPAGLGLLEQRQFVGMYSVLPLDRQHSFLAYAHPLMHNLSIAAGWIHFGVSDIDGRDINGNPTGNFNDSENAFLMAAGYKIGFMSIGVTAKYLHHTLANSSASGFSFDSGIKINLLKMLSLGFVVQDLAGTMSWESDSDIINDLPLTLRGGLAFEFQKFPASIASDIVKTANEDIRVNVGAEYRILKVLGLRAGYNNNELAFGGFAVAKTSFLDFQFDYAYGNEVFREGGVHRIGVMVSF